MKIISCVLFMLTCLSQIGVIAQNTITLSGKITDQHGTPLSLVTIAVENTTSGTYTDDNGRVFPESITWKMYTCRIFNRLSNCKVHI